VGCPRQVHRHLPLRSESGGTQLAALQSRPSQLPGGSHGGGRRCGGAQRQSTGGIWRAAFGEWLPLGGVSISASDAIKISASLQVGK
jgi:hypothetical protein